MSELDIPPLQDLLDLPAYGALEPEKKLEAIRNWERESVKSRNAKGDWTVESRARFEVETRQARQRALGVEPQSPETILKTLVEEEADPELDGIREALAEVTAAKREQREIDRRRIFPWMREEGDLTRLNELTGQIERVASEVGEQNLFEAQEAADALDGKRDTAVLRGKLIVHPDLYFDRDRFVAAVNAAPVVEREKSMALATYYRGREAVAGAMLPELQGVGSFREFAAEFAAANPDATKGQVVEAFRKSGRGEGGKWADALLTGFVSAMEGVGYLGVGFGKIAEKQGELLEKVGLTYPGRNLQEAAQTMQREIFENPVVSLRETAKAKQAMGARAELLGGYSTGQELATVGGQLFGQVTLMMLSGGLAGIGKALVGGAAESASAAIAQEMAKSGVKKWTKEYVKNWLGPLGTMAGASSAGPVLYEAYEGARMRLASEGLVGEELEVAARSEALTKALRQDLVTRSITSIFGTNGAESVSRLTQIAASPAAREALKKTVKEHALSVAKGSLGEAFEEALDEGINGGLDALLENPDMTFDDWVRATAFGGAAGGLFGGGISAFTNAAEAAVNGVRSSPAMEARRAAVENLRAAGLPGPAAAMEQANAVAEQEAIDLALNEIEANMERDVARLTELDEALASIPDGDARREPLVAERDEINARMTNQAETLRNYDPVATANVAVADLVDGGMDVGEARQRVSDLVNRKYSRVPVAPEALAAEVLSQPAPEAEPRTPQADEEGIQQTDAEAETGQAPQVTPVTPVPATPSFRAIAGRPVTVDGEGGDVRIDDDGTVLLEREGQPPIILSRDADQSIAESEFSIRIDEEAERDAEQARVIRTTIGGRPTARPIERPAPRTTFVRDDGAIVTGSTVTDFVNEGETEDGDLFVTVRDREGNEFELHGDDALTVAIARRDTARDADLETAVGEAIQSGPALDFDRVLARLVGPKSALLEVTTRSSETVGEITPETVEQAVDELTELESQIQNENLPADLKSRLLEIVNDAFEDVAQFSQRLTGAPAPDPAAARPASPRRAEAAPEPAPQAGEVTTEAPASEVTTPPPGETTGNVPRALRALVSSLNQAGVSIHFTTSAELAALTEQHGARVDASDGLATGVRRSGLFSDRSGTPRIYVLTDKSSSPKRTLLHEARHAANSIGRKANPEAHAAAVEALQSAPDLLKAAAKKYPGFAKLSPERQLSEVLSMMADGKLEARTIPSAILRFVESVLAALRGSVLVSEVSEISGYFSDLSALLAANPVPVSPTLDTETARTALEATADTPAARAEIARVLTPEQREELGVDDASPAASPSQEAPAVETEQQEAPAVETEQQEAPAVETEQQEPPAPDAQADPFPVDPVPLDASPVGPRNSATPEGKRHAELEAKFNAGTITPEETAEAQALVEQRAKERGLGFLGTLFHGTKKRFTSFRSDRDSSKLIYFSKDREMAENYPRGTGGHRTPEPEVADRISKVRGESRAFADRLFEENPVGTGEDFDLELANRLFEQVHQFERDRLDGMTASQAEMAMGIRIIPAYLETQNLFDPRDNWREFLPTILDVLGVTSESQLLPQIKTAIENGNYLIWETPALVDAVLSRYDSILIQEDQGKEPRTIAVRNPNQIKSAEPFTGVPLDERFNPESDSILEAASRKAPGIAKAAAELNPSSVESIRGHLKKHRLVSDAYVLGVLKDFPTYLDDVISFILDQRKKWMDGAFTNRDIAKAYVMTVASQGSDSVGVDVIRKVFPDFNPPEEYLSTGKQGQALIRPEEAAAYWLFTEKGQRALDAIEQGKVDAEAWADLAKIRAVYGDDRITNTGIAVDSVGVEIPVYKKDPKDKTGKKRLLDADGNPIQETNPDGSPKTRRIRLDPKKQFNLTNITALTEQVRESAGDWNKLKKALLKLRGIGDAKNGFMGHLLGFGQELTLDAVEANFWITGTGDTSQLGRGAGKSKTQKLREEYLNSLAKAVVNDSRASQDLSDRIKAAFRRIAKTNPDAAAIPEEVFNHVMHHWLWDRAKGIETTHEGMMKAQALATNPQTSYTPESEWSEVVDALVDRAVEKYPGLNAAIDTSIPAPARTVGLQIAVNPVEMATYTDGMSEADAAATIDKIFMHEAVHRHAVAEVGDQTVRDYADAMTADERLDTAMHYLHRSAYPTDEAWMRAVEDFAGDNPNISEGERRVRRYRLGHESLRMRVERLATGFTTEEDLAFYQTNPGNFARFVRYLKSYLNRLREWYASRKDPVLGVEVRRLARVLDEIENGPRVHRGEAPFSLGAAPSQMNPTDARYLELAKDPEANREELQSMADEAARRKGERFGMQWHGGTFNVEDGDSSFEEWSHFGTRAAAEERVGGSGIVDGLINSIEVEFLEDGPEGEGWYYSLDGIDDEVAFGSEKEAREAAEQEALTMADNAEPGESVFTPVYLFGNFPEIKDLGTWGIWDVIRNLPDEYKLTSAEREAVSDKTRGVVGEDWAELEKFLKAKGVDGFRYRNQVEDKGSTSYLIVNRAAVKSADPVTYDEAGNVIPLSQRFNSESDSILEAARRGIYNRAKPGQYVSGGSMTAAGWWDRNVYKMLEAARGKYQSEMKAVEIWTRQVSRAVKRAFKADPSVGFGLVNTALGNTDNRLTEADVAAIKDIKKKGLAAAQSAYMTARAQANQLEASGDRAGAALLRQDSRIAFNAAVADYKARAADYEGKARAAARDRAKAARDAALEQLPEDIRETVADLRSRIDQLSNRMKAEGNLSKELKATIDENLGLWLHRSYEIFDDPNYKQWIDEQRDPEAVRRRNRALLFIRGDLERREAAKLIGRGATPAAAKIQAKANISDAIVQDVLDDYLMVADGGSKHLITGSTVSKETAALMKRGTIPQEIQELWGRYDDPLVNAAKSMSAVAQFLSINDFFHETLDLGVKEGWLVKPTDGVPKTDRQGRRLVELFPDGKTGRFGNTASNQYAPLAGYWGPPELAEALKQTVDDRAGHKWVRAFTQLTGYSMASKTALSVQSNHRNFLGNILPTLINGNMVMNPVKWRRAARLANIHMNRLPGDFRVRLTGKAASKAEIAEVERLVRLGILGDNVTENLVRDLTGGFGTKRKAVGLKAKLLAHGWLKKVSADPAKALYDMAGREYSVPDDYWKIINFYAEETRVRRYRPDATPEAIEAEAAEIVKNTLPTYSRAPEVVKFLRRQPILAPFITFPSEMVRISWGQFRTAVGQVSEGVRTGNRELLTAGLYRSASLSVLGTLFYFTPSIVRGLLGFSEDDEDDLREHVAPWSKNATIMLLPSDDRTEGINYMDVSYMNPYDVLFRPLRSILRNLRDDDVTGFQMAMDAVLEAADPVLSEQILLGSILDARSGVAPSGRAIWEKQDDEPTKLAKSLAYVMQQALLPGTLASGDRIRRAAIGEVSPTGKAYDLPNEIAAVLGPRVSTVDIKTTMRMAGGQFRGDTLDARAVFARKIKSRGTQSDRAILSSYREADELMFRAFRDLREKYVGAIELGAMTRQEVVQTLSDAGMSRNHIADLLANRYRRIELRPNDLSDARREGQKLGQDRISLYRQALEETPRVRPISEDTRQ